MQTRIPQIFLGLLALAIGLVWTGKIAANAVLQSRSDQSISVTGSAKKSIRSDNVVWSGRIYADSYDLKSAYTQLQSNVQKFKAATGSFGLGGIKFNTVTSETYATEDVREDGARVQRSAFRVYQTFEIADADVDKITASAGKVAEAVLGQGIPLESNLQYLYTKLPELRLEMLQAATEDAKQRAETIAKGTGGHIGGAQSARMGVFQITPRNSTQVDDYGSYDTSSIDKDITAVVSVNFKLEK